MTELYPGYLTVVEAAEQCAVHTETVKRWIWAKRLPSRLVHGVRLIRRVDLDALEDRQERLMLGLEPESCCATDAFARRRAERRG